MASLTRSRSRIEPTMSSHSKPDRLLLKPQRRLSRTRTSARSWKCSTMCRPMKPAPPVIKTRIGEYKRGAPIQRSVDWKVEISTGTSMPGSLTKTVNLSENFWRFEQSIVASTRYECECWFRRPRHRADFQGKGASCSSS